jgi:hypothetical protein
MVVICPRCQRQAVGWPLRRADRCSPKDWAKCLREPDNVRAVASERRAKLEAELEELEELDILLGPE